MRPISSPATRPGASPPTPPLPTAVEELAEYFIVRDANGQALTYVYFEDASAVRSRS